MNIRRLELCDASDYRALRLRGLRDHADAFTSSFEEESLRPLADTEKRLACSSEKLWGAFAGGQLVGMVGLSFETRLKSRHKATLVGMYVADEFAGRGWGHALVETVVREASACGLALVVLTVTDGNQAACTLYTQAGFTTLGIEPDAIRINGIGYGKQHMFLQLSLS